MAGKIRVLAEQTINQIAAGEVIENPASVVKELVENAVDAGASAVCIETLGGGHQLIRISDNGSGMGREDAILSLERHATSKIGSAEDLFALETMGFRGEALASIGAIAKVTLLTAADHLSATAIEVEGGKILSVEPGARAQGTTIEVRSLFYNVPARKKFQKSAPICSAEITKVVTQMALAHPQVGFELIQQERSVFSVAAGNGEDLGRQLFERSGILLGEDFQLRTFKLELELGPCLLKGVIGTPLTHRHNRSGQHLFINKRPVSSPLISYAIRDGYGTRLPSDRHPIYVVHLAISPHLVDVNVHPQKKEVRLRDEKLLRDSIQTAVNLALQNGENPQFFSEPLSSYPRCEPPPWERAESFPLRFQESREEKVPQIPLPLDLPPVIGLFSHYLLLEGEGATLSGMKGEGSGLFLLDLEAAEARVLFERTLSQANTAPLSQGLLIPLTIHLECAEAALVAACPEEWSKLGIDLRPCGRNAFFIDALPPFVVPGDAEEMIKELLAAWQSSDREGNNSDERLRHLARTACRFARARKKRFMLQEAQELFKQLLLTSSPYLCPHGKPTLVYVSEDEIKEKFSRNYTAT